MEGPTLYQLASRNDLDAVSNRCDLLPSPQAIIELTYRGRQGLTVLPVVLSHDASLALLQKMSGLMKSDPRKRNLFATPDDGRRLPLHWCAYGTTDVQALEFAIAQFPLALARETRDGGTPSEWARKLFKTRANHAAVVRCLEEKTVVHSRSDWTKRNQKPGWRPDL